MTRDIPIFNLLPFNKFIIDLLSQDPFYKALAELSNSINVEIDGLLCEGPPGGEFLILPMQSRLDLLLGRPSEVIYGKYREDFSEVDDFHIKDLQRIKKLIAKIFNQYDINCCIELPESYSDKWWKMTIPFHLNYDQRDYLSLGQLIDLLPDFIASEFNHHCELHSISLGDSGFELKDDFDKVSTFIDRKCSNEEFVETIENIFNSSLDEFIININAIPSEGAGYGLLDEGYLTETEAWADIYNAFHLICDEETLQKKIDIRMNNKSKTFKLKARRCPSTEATEIKMIKDSYRECNSHTKLLEEISYVSKISGFNSEGLCRQALDTLNYLVSSFPSKQSFYLRAIYKSRLFKDNDFINLQEAIDDFSKSLENDVTWGQCYLERGRAYCSINEKVKATSDWKIGATLENKEAEALLLSDYNQSIRFEPNVQSFLARGDLYMELGYGYSSKAIQDYKSALQLDPKCNHAIEGIKKCSTEFCNAYLDPEEFDFDQALLGVMGNE